MFKKTNTLHKRISGKTSDRPKDKTDNKKTLNKTNWGHIASKYNDYLTKDSTYHSEVVWPNLKRITGEAKGLNVLDIACGQGYFSNLINIDGGHVTGFDLGADLIEIAKKNNKNIHYFVMNAEGFNLSKVNDKHLPVEQKIKLNTKFDLMICVLAIQNIENVKSVFESAREYLKDDGRFIVVLNHPNYRIPKYSSWGVDNQIQYRRIDEYMSESKLKLDMSPSEKNIHKKQYTVSFHRPLQWYFKIFNSTGFVVSKLEEWISHKDSEGKNAERENKSRKEFPMFMCLELRKSK